MCRMNSMAGSEIRNNRYDGYNTILYGYSSNHSKSTIFPSHQVIDSLDASRWIKNDLYHQLSNAIIDRKINTISMSATGMYSYDERYIFSINIRSNVSSRFG